MVTISANVSRIVKLSIAAAILTALWFFSLKQIHAAIVQVDYVTWIAPLALVIATLPFVVLVAIGFSGRSFFLLGAGLSFLYLVFFPRDLFLIPAIAFLIFGFWRAYSRTQFELRNNIRFAPGRIIKSAGSIVLLVLLLVISFNVYANIDQQIEDDPAAFYERLSRSVTKGVLPVVERQFPGFQPELSLDQFIIRSLNESDSDFRNLPSEVRREQVALSRNQIMQQLGIEADGSEPLAGITQLAVQGKIQELIQPQFAGLVPVVFALAIFSLLRILTVFAMWLIQAWGLLLFWLLRKTGFIRISQTEILAEYVEI